MCLFTVFSLYIKLAGFKGSFKEDAVQLPFLYICLLFPQMHEDTSFCLASSCEKIRNRNKETRLFMDRLLTP